MKITFDLQGDQSMFMVGRGSCLEVLVIRDEDSQEFGLEGSLGALRSFFESGLRLVQSTEMNGGDQSDTPIIHFGPEGNYEETVY